MRHVPALLSFCLLLVLACLPAHAFDDSDPLVGKWHITGWEPGVDPNGAPSYQGTGSFTRLGEGYVFESVVDNLGYEGLALFNPDGTGGVVSLAYRDANQHEFGVTALRLDDGVLTGRWYLHGEPLGRVGREVWKKLY